MEVRGSISVVLVVLFVENKRNIKCVDVSEIQMPGLARVRNVSSFPFSEWLVLLRVVSSGRRLAVVWPILGPISSILLSSR